MDAQRRMVFEWDSEYKMGMPKSQLLSTSEVKTLKDLRRTSEIVRCPCCKELVRTRVEEKQSKLCMYFALVLCFSMLLRQTDDSNRLLTLLGWPVLMCCVPWMISSLQDIAHNCPKCGAKLARQNMSGRHKDYWR